MINSTVTSSGGLWFNWQRRAGAQGVLGFALQKPGALTGLPEVLSKDTAISPTSFFSPCIYFLFYLLPHSCFLLLLSPFCFLRFSLAWRRFLFFLSCCSLSLWWKHGLSSQKMSSCIMPSYFAWNLSRLSDHPLRSLSVFHKALKWPKQRALEFIGRRRHNMSILRKALCHQHFYDLERLIDLCQK